MASHKGECQIVFNIKQSYDGVLKAVQESPYTTKIYYGDDVKAAGKFTFTFKGLNNVILEVCGNTTMNIYFKKGSLTESELTTLIKGLKNVFYDKLNDPDSLTFRKIVPSPAWMREVFYASKDGKMLKKLEQIFRELNLEK